MEYAYATLLLNESDEEINETNLTAVLEASGCAVETSRIKALVAALEGVDLDGAVPADFGEGSRESEHERRNGHGGGVAEAAADSDSDSQSETTETDADSQNEESTGASEGQPGDDATAET